MSTGQYFFVFLGVNYILYNNISDCCLTPANSAIFQLYHDDKQVNCQWDDDEVALYYMLSLIIIVLAHWNNISWRDMSPHSYIILIPSQPVFVLSP